MAPATATTTTTTTATAPALADASAKVSGHATTGGTTTTPIELPIFDISAPMPTPEAGAAMLEAAARFGFLYVDVRSTGFTRETVDGMFAIAEEFFAAPVEEKATCLMCANRGWSGMHGETLDPEHQERGDFKEVLNFGDFLPEGKSPTPLPPILARYESAFAQFSNLCRTTSTRILTHLAAGLCLEPADWFARTHDPACGPSGRTFRLLHYPAAASNAVAGAGFRPGVDVRAGAHSDYGSITLLFQRDGQSGLEIRPPGGAEGAWAPVPVRPRGRPVGRPVQAEGSDVDHAADAAAAPPPILVNIGDLLSYWTCGLLKSTVHRVVFPDPITDTNTSANGKDNSSRTRDRYSIAYFCHPADKTRLVPVPSPLLAKRQQQQQREREQEGKTKVDGEEAITAAEYLKGRLAATYI